MTRTRRSVGSDALGRWRVGLAPVMRALVAACFLVGFSQTAAAIPLLTPEAIPEGTGFTPLASSPAYNNTSTSTGFFFPVADGQVVGDTITLAGSDRVFTEISLFVFFRDDLDTGVPASITADATISLYGGVSPFDPLIFSTTLFGETFANDSFSVLTAPGDRALLPDIVTWTLEFNNRSVTDDILLGPGIFDPPTVGSSDDTFWIDGGLATFGAPVANFGAELKTAPIPEPSAALLFAVGGLIVGRAVRKRANA